MIQYGWQSTNAAPQSSRIDDISFVPGERPAGGFSQRTSAATSAPWATEALAAPTTSTNCRLDSKFISVSSTANLTLGGHR
jgi:hypothetical protein